MKKFRTIVFDLGGVLIDYSLERSIEAFRRIGYGQIETLIDPYRQSGVLLQLEKGEVGPEALYDEISRSVGPSGRSEGRSTRPCAASCSTYPTTNSTCCSICVAGDSASLCPAIPIPL